MPTIMLSFSVSATDTHPHIMMMTHSVFEVSDKVESDPNGDCRLNENR